MVTAPKGIEVHEPKYRSAAWQEYSIQELGNWVHLFVKRAGMRSPDAQEKARKDLADAQNYLDMIQAHLDAAKEQVG